MSESKSGRSREELEAALDHARSEEDRCRRETDEWEDEIYSIKDELDDLDAAPVAGEPNDVE